MLKKLFGSEIRVKLLNKFLMNPDKEFYLRELSSSLSISPRSVSVELNNLLNIDLIKKRISGNHHYYSANTQHLIFEELQSIFTKTVGVKNVIAKNLESFKSDILFSFIYGSISKGNATSKSDIDLFIIGNVSSRKISSALLNAGSELNREINFSIFKKDEFEQRLKSKDHFIISIIKESKIFVIGNPDEFEGLGKERLAETT